MTTRENREAVEQIVRRVRRRWRTRALLNGAALGVAALGVAVFVVAGLAGRGVPEPGSLLAARALLGFGLVAVLAWAAIRPLLRRVPDVRVALYIEEHEPALEAELLSAVEVGSGGRVRQEVSPALVSRLIADVVEKCRRIDGGRAIERPRLARSGAGLGTALLAVAVLFLAAPTGVRDGLGRLFRPRGGLAASPAYSITVLPGDATVPKGGDVSLRARLVGFRSDSVRVRMKVGAATEFQQWPMTPAPKDEHEFIAFGVTEPAEYYVEAEGVRSPVYHLKVADLPFVRSLRLEYVFPAYTGLPQQVIEEGGDIAVPVGTTVRVRATPTAPVDGGLIRLDDARALPLERAGDGTLAGSMRIERDGFYHIELAGPTRTRVAASPQYTISALPDRPAAVSISKPGRDTKVTAVDEVFVEARAEDDYGVAYLELVYSVNGGPPQTRRLHTATGGGAREITAGHTFYLEELSLQPGDFISYFARAADNNPAAGARPKSTDIYFLEVRPFSREYRQAEQRGGMPGGGQQGESQQELSQRQREIIAASFNLVRDQETYRPAAYKEHVRTLALAQGRLQEQTETLVQRIRNRGVIDMDSAFAAIAELLTQAAGAMRPARDWLDRERPDSALSPEQKALQLLLRAEAVYREVQVTQQQDGGGGGGGSQSAEDLADLFELELDRNRNQYETVQRGSAEQAQNQLDEAREKLRELARRQQQELERLRRAGSQQQAQVGSGGSQRQLAEETEEEARRLERLSRERNDPQLAEAARGLQQAADAMRRAAANDRRGAGAQGRAAADRLDEATRRLERAESERASAAVEQARQRAQELAEQQRGIGEQVQEMGEEVDPRKLGQIVQDKARLGQGVRELEQQLDQLARETRRDQRDASRRLQDAANSMRQNQLGESIRQSMGAVATRSPEYARQLEQRIGRSFDELLRRLDEVPTALGESPEQRAGSALERARQLARALESMNQRTRDGAYQQGRVGGYDPRQPLSPEERRQLEAELRQRVADAQQLREELRALGADTRPLEEWLGDLRAMNDGPARENRALLDRIQQEIIAGLKEYELGLRRALAGDDPERVFLSGSGEVPPAYRKIVEDYYRSLSSKRRP